MIGGLRTLGRHILWCADCGAFRTWDVGRLADPAGDRRVVVCRSAPAHVRDVGAWCTTADQLRAELVPDPATWADRAI